MAVLVAQGYMFEPPKSVRPPSLSASTIMVERAAASLAPFGSVATAPIFRQHAQVLAALGSKSLSTAAGAVRAACCCCWTRRQSRWQRAAERLALAAHARCAEGPVWTPQPHLGLFDKVAAASAKDSRSWSLQPG